ncbi:hypothetical protein ACF0H5_005501 [Mactra antiquata]
MRLIFLFLVASLYSRQNGVLCQETPSPSRTHLGLSSSQLQYDYSYGTSYGASYGEDDLKDSAWADRQNRK